MGHTRTDLFERLEAHAAKAPERGLQTLLIELVREIEDAMQAQGLTRAEVARRAGVKREYISRILNNPQNVTVATLVRVANAVSGQLRITLRPCGDPRETAEASGAPNERRRAPASV